MPTIEKLPAGVTHEPGPGGNWIYRNFHIVFVHPTIPIRTMDYGYYHDDYDGADDAHDARHGNGASIADCVKQIDEWYECEELEDANPDWENDRNAHLKGLGDKPYVAGPKEQWAIVSTGDHFVYGLVDNSKKLNNFPNEVFLRQTNERLFNSWFVKKEIVAYHPTKELCEAAFKRAQKLEKQLRPLWQQAIEFEQKVKNYMLDAVWAEAKK